jgi:hypothetical protein
MVQDIVAPLYSTHNGYFYLVLEYGKENDNGDMSMYSIDLMVEK